MKKNRIIFQIATIMVLGVFLSSCAIYHHYGSYYGKVVDAETKEPLEGAAVLAVYYTQSYGPAGSISHYLDAQEAVTDNKGEFKIPPLRAVTFRSLQSFDPYPLFTIFKPGYGCYPTNKRVKLLRPNATLPEDTSVNIGLPKLVSLNERRDNLLECDSDVPRSHQQNLIMLLNQERKSLGYNSLY